MTKSNYSEYQYDKQVMGNLMNPNPSEPKYPEKVTEDGIWSPSQTPILNNVLIENVPVNILYSLLYPFHDNFNHEDEWDRF